ncbi:heavy-metal-associated domain-containing protein [Carboxylicivirga mesophila]|uniref:Heavy-metal-associated domain-containing protein n=1 Tax=Carboxylicivirga mesophila TaxID=1166478 RepID=A0ABS5KCQ2_9BACT|nr:heavy-metal-associated domain-containing protein [Carboxylicivirga mesophila]MBS2212652.1 heavy-metal-associated domain-containing protein [Carboxylicivirga mesophila]
MKTKILVLAMVFSTVLTMAGEKSETFKVYGNCGMCEKRIEGAAKELKGVSAADWDQKNKMMRVVYDDQQVEITNIHLAIANAGHDTGMQMAKDDTYSKLPGCCKYERAAISSQKEGMHMKHNKGEGESGCTMPKKANASGCCGK